MLHLLLHPVLGSPQMMPLPSWSIDSKYGLVHAASKHQGNVPLYHNRQKPLTFNAACNLFHYRQKERRSCENCSVTRAFVFNNDSGSGKTIGTAGAFNDSTSTFLGCFILRVTQQNACCGINSKGREVEGGKSHLLPGFRSLPMFAINSMKLSWAGVHPGVRLCNKTPPGAAPRAALGVCGEGALPERLISVKEMFPAVYLAHAASVLLCAEAICPSVTIHNQPPFLAFSFILVPRSSHP